MIQQEMSRFLDHRPRLGIVCSLFVDFHFVEKTNWCGVRFRALDFLSFGADLASKLIWRLLCLRFSPITCRRLRNIYFSANIKTTMLFSNFLLEHRTRQKQQENTSLTSALSPFKNRKREADVGAKRLTVVIALLVVALLVVVLAMEMHLLLGFAPILQDAIKHSHQTPIVPQSRMKKLLRTKP